MMRLSKVSSKVTLIVLCMCARGMLICRILYQRHRYAAASSQSMRRTRVCSGPAAANLLGINMQCMMLQMSKLAHGVLHDKQTLICACQTLVLISSISRTSRGTGRELLDVCNSLMQFLGCINDL